MIKDYRSRVIGTYDFLRAAISEVNQNQTALLKSVATLTSKQLPPCKHMTRRQRIRSTLN